MARTRVFAANVAAALVAAVAGCGDASVHAPLSPAAARVRYAEAPQPGCSRIGRALGVGTDADERIARRRALDGAREQAAKLGGNLIVYGDRKVVSEGVLT